MAKPRTMKKMWVGKSTRRHGSPRERQTPTAVRRETNEEIMHRSALTHGYIHIRFQPQIFHTVTRTYAGYQRAAIAIDVDEIKRARELIERVHETVRQYVEERGLAAPETNRPRAFGW